MKKWLSKKSNIIFILLLIFIFIQKIPVIKNNFKNENKTIKSISVRVLNSQKNEQVNFPPKDRKSIAIFWASWCVPCKVEMSRLKQSVESKSIPQESIFAINPFETESEVKEFLKNNSYPFTFISHDSIASDLNIMATPTTLLIDQNKIVEMSTGMSLWGIWKVELIFFN